MASIKERLSRPVSAIVIDLFRILAGLLIVVYYIRLFREFSLYTSETGLLDHALQRELFWFTKLSLFYPGCSPTYKIFWLVVGLLGALSLTLGVRPKLGAAVSWIVAVSVHRWNFAVINLDDSSITLLLWWMLFLPIGHTLTLSTFRGRSDWRSEAQRFVNGFFLRAFFANLFIYYLTAGLTKLASALWREGYALYVVLNLPLARTQGMWSVEHLPLLWLGNHFTLIMEPLFPFLLLLRKGSPIKYVGGVCWALFHLGIATSIGVVYANLTLVLTLILVFHEELGDLIRRRAGEGASFQLLEWKAPRGTQTLIVSYLLVLLLAMQKGVPGLKVAWEPAMALLYLGGVAQEYHLFDWIDRYNWTIHHKIVVIPEGGAEFEMPSTAMFEHSIRGFIVQSYLLPVRWMRVPRPLTGEMRNSVLERAAQHFVQTQSATLGPRGKVLVYSKVGRVEKRDLLSEELWEFELMEFEYDGERARITFPRLPSADREQP